MAKSPQSYPKPTSMNDIGDNLLSFFNSQQPPNPMDAALAMPVAPQAQPNVMQDIGHLANQLFTHGSGRHVKTGPGGVAIDPQAPQGLDWLEANGPNRQSVHDRYAAMQAERQGALNAGGAAVAAKKLEQQSFDPSVLHGANMNMAYKDGQPVGFSTFGQPGRGIDPIHVAPDHLPQIDGLMQTPNQATNAAAQLAFFDQGGLKSNAPVTPPPSDLSSVMDPINAILGIGGAQHEAPANVDPRTKLPMGYFNSEAPVSNPDMPNGLIPYINSAAAIGLGDLKDLANQHLFGEQTHKGGVARQAVNKIAHQQSTYKPPTPQVQAPLSQGNNLSNYYGPLGFFLNR